ncbi:MAG: sulfite exporter TauE/SafE family protein [Clostridioides sp.]|jgi:uncharacterized membrane protein YfcA|nr:sulfite exporter TauE/SafE family protein [Clostridioides sp.]
MIVNVLRALFLLGIGSQIVVLGGDYTKAKKEGKLKAGYSVVKSGIIGYITDLCDTLGIGSFAITIALFKFLKMDVPDKKIPGTLNVAHSIPTITEALVFTAVVAVDPLTLILMIGAAVVGSYVGASIVAKMNDRILKIILAIALLVAAFVMTLSHPYVNLMPVGGDSIGLEGTKLVIGVVGNFILGALMTAGIGLYGPCMAMVYMLGMSPAAAFPIMMGSCALLMPTSSIKFVKEDDYAREVSIPITIFGVLGVISAVTIFKNLPMDILKILVILVIIYTAINMLMSVRKKENKEVL